MIAGDATVPEGRTLVLHGMVTGDVVVEAGGTAIVNGTVVGSVLNRGRVEVAGVVGGSVTDEDKGVSTVRPTSLIGGDGR